MFPRNVDINGDGSNTKQHVHDEVGLLKSSIREVSSSVDNMSEKIGRYDTSLKEHLESQFGVASDLIADASNKISSSELIAKATLTVPYPNFGAISEACTKFATREEIIVAVEGLPSCER